MATSPFLGLNLYDLASGSATTFLDFRLAVTGNLSNMTIIDTFSQDTSASISSLRGSVFQTVSASEFSANNYHATVGSITSYATNMAIILRLNTSNTGAATININSLGDVSFKKINSSGNIVDIDSGDLLLNQYYLFQYNGTYFVWIGSVGSTSGSGAPTDAYYIVSGSSSLLTNEKVITAGSNITLDSSGSLLIIHSGSVASGTTYSGSPPISISGSVVSHNTSGITTGSYNRVYVNSFGHVISGSNVDDISSVSGSGIMSTTTGSVIKHNASSVTAGSYLSANIVIDTYGHITSAENGVSASSVGAPSDSPFVTTASSLSLTNYSVITAGSNIFLENTGGSLIISASAIRTPSIIIASASALSSIKSGADYVCDGIADETEFISAINELPSSGGQIILSDGTFNFSANYSVDTAVGFSKSYVIICGQGESTIINVTTDIVAFSLLGGTGSGWYYPDAQSGVVFKNIKFTATTARTGAGIKNVGGINHLVVSNNYFENLSKCLDFAGQAHGVLISNNYSEGNRIFIRGAVAASVLHDFRIIGNKDSGMELAGKDGTPVYFVYLINGEMFQWIIANNSIEHIYDNTNSSVAMLLQSSLNADIIISNNSIEESDYGILYVGNFISGSQILSNPLISENSFRNLKNIIQIEGTASGKISDNLLINIATDTTYRGIISNNFTSGSIYAYDNFMTGFSPGYDYVVAGSTGGSVILSQSSITTSSISGSSVMSDTAGSVVKHNTSGVTSGSYLSANVTIDSFGHITTIENGVSASSVGAPSDSLFVTTGSSSSLTNYSIITAGSNISLDIGSGSVIIHSQSSGSSGGAITLLDTQSPSGSAVTFSDISGLYKKIIIEWVARSTQAATHEFMTIAFNDDMTDSNYREIRSYIYGAGTAGAYAADDRGICEIPGSSASSNSPNSGTMEINSYAGTTFNKIVRHRSAYRRDTSSIQILSETGSMEWESTSAITKIYFALPSGNFVTGSVFYLYGVS